MRLVLVEWVDSFGCSAAWQDITDSVAVPLHCRSVGWLLHDTDDCKVIVPHLSEAHHPSAAPQGCGDMTIPTCAVTRMIDLADPREG